MNTDFDLDECCICLEKMDLTDALNLYQVRCGHVYHVNCINKWIKYGANESDKCPNCRRIMSNRTLSRINDIYKKLINKTGEYNKVKIIHSNTDSLSRSNGSNSSNGSTNETDHMLGHLHSNPKLCKCTIL